MAREELALGLVFSAKSNREIAQTLFVSPNTVANQVRSILGSVRSAPPEPDVDTTDPVAGARAQ